MSSEHMRGAADPDRQQEPPERIQGSNPTARAIRQKIWKACHVENEHFVGAIVGGEGSGKSGAALSIAEAADPGFSADRVCFNGLDFMELIRSDDTGRGSGIVGDEAGAWLGNRTWYDDEQITLNQTLQTIRDDNMFVLFTLPRLNELDSQARGRVQALLEMRNKSEGEWVSFAWKNVNPTRDERNDIYKWYPRMRVNGRVQRVREMKVGPPSETLWEEYNERKAAFKDEQYEQTEAKLRDEPEEESLSVKEIAEEIKERDIEEFVSVHGGNGSQYINWKLIKAEYDLGRHDAKSVRDLLQKDSEVVVE